MSSTPCPSNTRFAPAYLTAAEAWISAGNARRIEFTQSSDGSTFTPKEQIPIGSLIFFTRPSSGGTSHIGIYAGYYDGLHFMTHVGSDDGPVIATITGMSKGGSPQVVSRVVVPKFVEDDGRIEVYKKDPNGKPLSGAYFSAVSSSNKTFVIGPTNNSGYAAVDGVPYDSYTVKETVFPENYTSHGQTEWNITVSSKNDGVAVVNAVNKKKQGTIKVIKSDAESGSYLSGAEFTVYDLGGSVVGKIGPSGSDGSAQLGLIDYGSYVVKETKVPDNYQPGDQTVWNVTINDTSPNIVLNITNNRQYGKVKIQKTAEDGFKSDFIFRLKGTSVYGEAVDMTISTGDDGTAVFDRVPIGNNYVITEENTPSRYVIQESQNVTVKRNETTSVSFNNPLKKFRITLQKTDGETGYPQGDSTLDGAVYGVYKGGQLLDTYTTSDGGRFTTKYYVCGADYTVCEITPSEGYLLDETIYRPGTADGLFTAEYNSVDVLSKEPVKKSNIMLVKHADDGDTGIEHPETGAEFEIYLKSAGSFSNARAEERDRLVIDENGFAFSKALPYGVYVVRQVKGDPAYELMPPFDVFIEAHADVYSYIINNAPFKAYIDIVKKDAETGKVIPVSGIGFKVLNKSTGEYITQHINYPTPMDIDTFYTDVTGMLRLPERLPHGQYSLIEQNTAYGYVLDVSPVDFEVNGGDTVVTVTKSNMPQKGTIKITKTGEVFYSVENKDDRYIPVYKEAGLAGAEFSVYAKEDIFTPDGTKRCEAGQKAASVISNSEGVAVTEPLYLGSYEVKEEKAPYGMVLDSTPITVTLTYAGQEVSVTSADASFTNERQKVLINLEKSLETDEAFGIGYNGEIERVTFGLYAKEDITAADGSVIPKDGLLDTVTVDADGKAAFSADIPVGALVYVKEIAADEHYILSDEKYPAEFIYAGDKVAVVSIALNDGQPIENKLIRADIKGIKKDEDQNAVEGAVFGLFFADETELIEENAVLTSVSDSDGLFCFASVPYGSWKIKELSCPPQYVLSDKVFEITVDADGAEIQIEAENKFKKGGVQVKKTDADDITNLLSGAEFHVYADKDGDKIFNAETDIFVDALKEDQAGIYTLDDLRYGGYFVYEAKAPENFVRDEEYRYFEITEDGKTVTVETKEDGGYINEPYRGSIRLIKKDADSGELLAGVEFVLTDSDGKEIMRGVTDENGELLFENIRFGSYRITETAEKDGYIKSDEITCAEITENGQTLTFELTNKKLPPPPAEVPKTGDGTLLNVWVFAMLCSLGVLAVLAYRRKKQY